MIQTHYPRAAALLATLLVFSSVLGVATAASAPPGEIATKQADLAIQEPSYVDGQVQTTSINGTTGYVVEGASIDIAPRNFDASSVVDYGVETNAGRLEYDSAFESYQFHPGNETGTFEVYWVVAEPVTVEQTNNGSTTNVTEMRDVRYESYLRVTGGTSITHVSEEHLAQLEENAEKGATLNATVQEMRERGLLFGDTTGSDEEVLERWVTRYVSTSDPFAAFTGNYTQMWMISILSLGGLLFLAQWLGLSTYLMAKLNRVRNKQATKRAHEGDLADRIWELDENERLENLANVDWQDIMADDHIAHAFNKHLGQNPRHGWVEFLSAILPENIVADRLRLMAVNGYTGVETDDGIDIVRDADVSEDDTTVSLLENTDSVVEDVNWNSATITEFDAASADLNRGDVSVEYDVLDLEELIERLDVQMEDFDDEQAYGEFLREFAESVRMHGYTDSEGRPNEIRHLFGELFQTAQLFDQKYNFPLADHVTDHLDAAIRGYDPGEKAAKLVKEVERGEHS